MMDGGWRTHQFYNSEGRFIGHLPSALRHPLLQTHYLASTLVISQTSRMKHIFPWLCLFFLVTSFNPKPGIDLLVFDATIYTVDAGFSVVEAMAIKDGKIIETGSTAALRKKYTAARELNAKGKFI